MLELYQNNKYRVYTGQKSDAPKGKATLKEGNDKDYNAIYNAKKLLSR